MCKMHPKPNTIYSQERRHFTKTNVNIFPRRSFKEDFVSFIQQKITNAFSLIISLDSKKHTRLGNFTRFFRMLCLFDSISTIPSTVPHISCVNGSNSLDAIWVSRKIEVNTASICPQTFSVGDHRAVVIEIPMSSFLGSSSIPLLLSKRDV